MRALLAVTVLFGFAAFAQDGGVFATLETAPVDAGTQLYPRIWVHPSDPAKSLILAGSSGGGVLAYGLDGGEVVQGLSLGAVRSIDLRYGVVLGGVSQALIAVSLGSSGVDFFAIDPTTLQLHSVSAGALPVLSASGGNADKVALFRDSGGALFLWVSDNVGNLEEWRLSVNAQGKIEGTLVRSGLTLGGQAAGLAVDDFDQSLYATQSSVGLFVADATQASDAGFLSVDPLPSARLLAPLGALSVYQGRGGGYLLVTSGGDNAFAAYQLGARSVSGFVGRFTVLAGPTFGGVEGSTGQAVESFGIDGFPQGLFVAEDSAGTNAPNLKLVSWGDIADAGGLVIDATNDPRGGATDGGLDAGTDAGVDGGGPGSTGTPGSTGGPPSTTPPKSTGCSATGGVAASLLGLFALVLLAARRRRA